MAPDFVLAIRGDGRLARLGATRHFHHGLLTGAAIACLLGPAATAAAQTAPPAETAPANPTPLTTEAKIEQLDQQIRILARQIEIEKEASTAAAATAPAAGAGAGGFELRSADGAFRVRFRGYLHADSRLYGDDQESRGVDSFLLRRARPVFEATTFRIFDFRIMPDFGGGTTVVQDAYVDARFARRFNVRFGKTKAPVGQERLASATEVLFIERALPTALVPNRDVGLSAYGDLTPWLAYQAGVFNGVIDGGSTDGDATDRKDLVGRLVVSPFRASKHERLQPLSIGFAVTGGRELGTLAAPGLAQFRSGGQLVWFRYRGDATAAGTTIADGRRTRFATSGQYYTGPLSLQAEHVIARHDVRRAAVAERLEHSSWQATGAWVLTGETATGRGVIPRTAFDYAKDTWGAWEIVARVNALTVDADTFPTFANIDNSARSAKAVGLGCNWYLNRAVKISADYELTRFDGGAASGADREDEHAVFTRFQIAF
jgi:phosphate-selective porin OprO and OprP